MNATEIQDLIVNLIKEGDKDQALDLLVRLQETNSELEEKVKLRTRELEEMNVSLTESLTENKKNSSIIDSIFNSVPGLIYLYDESGKLVKWNSRHEYMTGYSSKELLQRNLMDWFKDDYESQNNIDSALNTMALKGYGEAEANLQKKSGSGFPVYFTFSALKINDLQYFTGIGTDISRIKKAEEKIKESYTVLRIAGENAKLGGWSADLANNKVYWSDEVAVLHEMPVGYSPSVEEGINFYTPEWREKITKVFTNCTRNGIPYDEEMEIITASGKRIWIQTIGEAVKDDAGNIIKIQGAFQDISERKQVNKLLQQERELYLDLVNHQPAGIYRIRVLPMDKWENDAWTNSKKSPYTMELASDRFCEILGKTRQDFEANPFLIDDLVYPQDKSDFKLRNEEANAKLLPFRWEGRMLIQDKICWVHLESIPRTVENGEILWTGILYDITGSKQTELALKESDERFQLLFNEAPLGYQSLDIDGNFLEVNQQWLETLGYKREEVIGKWFGDFLTPMYQDGFRKRFPIFKAQGHIHSEFEMLHKNGSILFIAFEGRIGKDLEGNFRQTHCILQDITESKRANEALIKSSEDFMDLFDNAPIGYHEIDAEGRIVRMNQTELNMLGYTSGELIGKHFWSTITEEKVSRKAIEAKLSGEIVPLNFFEREFRKKDGTTLSVLLKDKLFKDKDGRITGIRTTVQDITERKKAEYELQINSRRLNAMVKILQSPADSIQDYLDLALSHAIEMTNSKLGYIYVYSEEKKEFVLNSWSKEVMKECEIREKQTVYQLGKTGLWGEAVRQCKPIVVNDFQSHHPLKKGYPAGHATLQNYLTIPVFRNKEIIAVVAVANKETDYNDSDLKQLSVLMDIVWNTLEKKQAEIALIESEEKFSKAFKSSPDLIMLTEFESGRIVEVNERLFEITGYNEEEFIGKTTNEIHYWANPEDRERFKNLLASDGFVNNMEVKLCMKSGELRDNLVSAEIIELQNGKFILGVNRDITELKKSEEELVESQKLLQEITDNSTSLIYALDTEGCFTLINKSLEKVFGRNRDALIGKKREEFMPKEIAEVHHANDLEVIETMQPITIEEESIESGGKHTYLSVKFPLVDLQGNLVGVSGISTDITERKQSEEKIIKLSRVNLVLSNVNQSIVHIRDKQELFNQVCKIAIEDGKLRMAWIGIINPQTNKVDVVASYGIVNGYLDSIDIDLNNPISSNGPTGISIKTAEHIYSNSFKTDIAMLPWREKALSRGYNSSISLPLFLDGKVIGNFSLYSEEENYFNTEEIEQLDKLAMNISFAMDFLENETQRKNAEDALRESKSKLDAALASTSDAIFITDAEGNYIEFNDAFVKFQRFNRKYELPANFKNFREIVQVYYSNGEIAPTEMWAIPRALKGETASNVEYKLQRKDTGESWVGSYSFAPILDDKGAIVGSVVVARDITELKLAEIKLQESEEKLSTLFASMTEMVALHELVLNEKGVAINYRIIDCNDAYSSNLGIKKEILIGKLADEVYQMDKAPYLEIYARVATSGESYVHNIYYPQMDRYFLISAVSTGKNKFSTIITDITEMEQVKEVVITKNKELENYIYVASHDLRSPLVNIQGFSQRLQKQTKELKQALEVINIEKDVKQNLAKIAGEAIPKSLDYILSNATKMDILIKGLLQVSRMGRIEMLIKKIDMNKLFKTILTHTGFELSEIGATVDVDDLSYCYGDENQLNQLFSNIIGNAIKYRNTERALKIKIVSHEQYNKVVYSISDNGIGIAERNMDKIWNVFYRVDASHSDSGEGIGLSLVKKIAEKHKGKVWAESKEGIGTIFNVELLKNKFEE